MVGILCSTEFAQAASSQGGATDQAPSDAGQTIRQDSQPDGRSSDAAGQGDIEPELEANGTGDPFYDEPGYDASIHLLPTDPLIYNRPYTFRAISSGSSGNYSGGNTFSTISRNISASLDEVPGLISSMAYILGTLLGVLGILKIKDHVDNPQQTELKQGAIRLAAGGALFALPIVYEAMRTTIGNIESTVRPADLSRAVFGVR